MIKVAALCLVLFWFLSPKEPVTEKSRITMTAGLAAAAVGVVVSQLQFISYRTIDGSAGDIGAGALRLFYELALILLAFTSKRVTKNWSEPVQA